MMMMMIGVVGVEVALGKETAGTVGVVAPGRSLKEGQGKAGMVTGLMPGMMMTGMRKTVKELS